MTYPTRVLTPPRAAVPPVLVALRCGRCTLPEIMRATGLTLRQTRAQLQHLMFAGRVTYRGGVYLERHPPAAPTRSAPTAMDDRFREELRAAQDGVLTETADGWVWRPIFRED